MIFHEKICHYAVVSFVLIVNLSPLVFSNKIQPKSTIVHPRILQTYNETSRRRRDIYSNNRHDNKVLVNLVQVLNWVLKIRENEEITFSEDIDRVNCTFHYGEIELEESVVSLTICDGVLFYGMIREKESTNFLEPLNETDHILYISYLKTAPSYEENNEKKDYHGSAARFNGNGRRKNRPRRLNNFHSSEEITAEDEENKYYDESSTKLNENGRTKKRQKRVAKSRYSEGNNIEDEERQNDYGSGLKSDENGTRQHHLNNFNFSAASNMKAGVTEDRHGNISRFGGDSKRKKRQLLCHTSSSEFFNLTGYQLDVPSVEQHGKGDGNMYTDTAQPKPRVHWTRERIYDDEGYFFDTAWNLDTFSSTRGVTETQERTRGEADPQHTAPPKWLEISLAVDHTVIDFHGKDKVRSYVMALMNIVSAIYKDPTMDSNIGLAITRLSLYADPKDGQVKVGNAKRSLKAVNRWNHRIYNSLRKDQPVHDIAVWLTRADIGGPSGYAPVSGVCDPRRSCALNRDEGFTSAFIIAHEMAHILGLSHDGDHKANNNCSAEASRGSVMAPMVAATFHRFMWSTCSRDEFHRRIGQWSCLSNHPVGQNLTELAATVTESFSMDEQCRLEFGDGYELCRQLDLVEPCSHLWCGHVRSPEVCKTKKGPPLAGTECGHNKWCMSGYCSEVNRAILKMAPVLHTSRDGSWSRWGHWGRCSRSCGVGVAFRSRKCNNPKPAGGTECKGRSEEFKICGIQECPEPLKDVRAQQCSRLVELVDLLQDERANMTWLPHESEAEKLKCHLTCASQQTGEIFLTGENLLDGTPCSYDSGNRICVQGVCHNVGCDLILNSKKQEDYCGVCGGNGNQCRNATNAFVRTAKRELSRIAVLPKHSRHINIEVNRTSLDDVCTAIIVRNREGRNVNITIDVDLKVNNRSATIVDGARFHFEKHGDRFTIWSNGPLLSELILLMTIPADRIGVATISVRSTFSMNKILSGEAGRYRWVVGGWGPCTTSCGGGSRHLTVACRDTNTGGLVTRPVTRKEKCNELSCDFNWLPGPWESCTTSCGSQGIQSRQLYCVHYSVSTDNVTLQNGSVVFRPWRFMLAPLMSSNIRPQEHRQCNRVACVSNWIEDDWSQCSTSCGLGFKSLRYRCIAPVNESLSVCEQEPVLTRMPCGEQLFTYCTTTIDSHSCTKDASQNCALESLHRYCVIPSYRNLCCKTCSLNALPE